MNPVSTSKPGLQILPPATCGDRLLFRVFDHAAPIGYARLTRLKTRRCRPGNVTDMFNPDGVACYELKMIEIAQNYRQRGVGTSLLQAVIRYCRDSNISLLTGEIKGDARTLRHWYRNNGFRITGNDRIELLPSA